MFLKANSLVLVLMNVKDRMFAFVSMLLTANFRPFDQKNPFLATILVNRELHSEKSERSCRHVEFDIEGSRIR